jgi:CheY-like chemotaxis protein
LASILLGIDDPQVGRELSLALTTAGHQVAVVAALETTPGPGRATPDLLVLDGDAPGMDVAVVAATWRRREPPPALIVLGATAAGRAQAARVNAPLFPKPADPDELVAEVHRLILGARDAHLTPPVALRALGLEGGGLPEDEAALILAGARTIDVALVREALRPHIYEYPLATGLVDKILQRRMLGPEEARLVLSLTGGRTVRGAIDGLPRAADDRTPIGALSSHQAARLMWALASSKAVVLGREPPPSHPTSRLRAHLRARKEALPEGVSHYQVLELGIDAGRAEIDHATMLAELRYGPEAQDLHDLGDLSGLAAQLWEQIVRARVVLGDARLRADYDATLVPRHSELEERRRRRRIDGDEGERLFQRGQLALAEGDIFRAVSDLAAAARRCPGNGDYEAYAAWARFLAEDARASSDPMRKRLAERERAQVEATLRGRRPWPRGLCALGLLAEAAGDRPGAVAFLREALAGDERLGPARHALARMGTSLAGP